jgi:hypothetical protein
MLKHPAFYILGSCWGGQTGTRAHSLLESFNRSMKHVRCLVKPFSLKVFSAEISNSVHFVYRVKKRIIRNLKSLQKVHFFCFLIPSPDYLVSRCYLLLPHDEILAMEELIKLQKEKVIVIKPCDKGAGMIILDYPVYMRACYQHINMVYCYVNIQSSMAVY